MDSSQLDKHIFSVRLVSIDYYMSPPIADMDISYSSFHGGKVKEVPVIRVYGPTPSGQKTCVHIHGALPYLYVPVSDIQLPDTVEGDADKNAVCLSLEKALKLKGSTGTKRQHVHGCSLVRGRKLYGYYSSEEIFIKIYFYHPQDVSRAANLMLGGAILERSLQPYESHIPFLLQFLVDYNLYGMGHLHLLKMKFRHLLDDLYGSETHISSSNDAAMTADSKEDLSGSNSRIWKASNIPEGWSWQSSGGLSTSLDAGTSLVKRHSLCELEGDAVVDDILNQQLKSYISLSQSPSDVKMVQSLIPIWQEEYQRSGIHAAEILSDPGKPLPDAVLKILSDGLDYEHKFLELCGKSNEVLTTILEKDIASLGSRDLAHSQLMVDSTSQKGDQVEDGEATTLLKWLASSQAADDINSDGELVRETLLSPLLPSATIHKVIENTNIGFEKQSQQECQDILDSVKDVIDFEGVKQSAYPDNFVESPEKKIPQVDGAGDDECSISAATSSDEELTRAQLHRPILRGKPKGRNSLWSPLPFSGAQGFIMDDGMGPSGSKNSPMASSLVGSAHESSPNPSGSGADTSVHGQGSKALHVCSVRDLMRKKRRYRFDPSESKASKSKFTGREEEKHICELQHQTDLPREETDSYDRKSSAHQYYLDTKHQNPETVPETINYVSEVSAKDDMNCEHEPNLDVVSDSDSESYRNKYDPNCLSSRQVDGTSNCKDLEQKETPPLSHLQIEMFHDGVITERDRNAGEVSAVYTNDTNALTVTSAPSDNFVGEEKTTSGTKGSPQHFMEEKELTDNISMTLLGKPPTSGCLNLVSKKAIYGHTSFQANDDRAVVEGRCLDEIPAIFGGECQTVLQSGDKCSSSRDLSRDLSMGVPIHYQNDGTYSYMLTPAFSPPSVDSVRRWLSSETSGIQKGGNAELKASSGEGSKGVQALHHGEPLSEFIQGSSLNPIPFQVSQQDQIHSIAQYRLDAKIIEALPEEKSPAKAEDAHRFSEDNSQLSGPTSRSKSTPLSQRGFRDPASVGSGQQLTLCSIEVQAESRGDLRPNPECDGINIISLAIQNDSSSIVDVHLLLRDATASSRRKADCILNYGMKVFSDERELLDHFVVLIRSYDPDILIGWDIQGGSVGFLAERASHLGISLVNKISRTASETMVSDGDSQILDKGNENMETSESAIPDATVLDDAVIKDEWGRTHASGLHVGGRIVLNLWRLIRGEVKLNMYSLEAVAEAVLHRKVPFFHWRMLSKWFSSGPTGARYRCTDYLACKTKLNLEIIDQLDMVNRTSELARVFGIDFFSVTNRGSQYRVESMLLRLAHMQNYIAISPGYQQVASQPAMECLPLVMEPESGFYADPVIVLDFQSLYPSMIIAYNLCFSTCLGKVIPSMPDRLGVSTYSPDLHVLRDLDQDVLLTPNGVMYVPAKVRKGVLPRLLEEILSTRIMVKKAMKKLSSSQKVLQRIFNARQLALKLIANVTYGYTAAGFSGRMPCAELADSIVQCGRRTLETAISLVNSHENWNARVIYGDTDSMFVLVKGRTKKEAFVIGQEIASAVSAMNPYPITLKMEKVYQPCFLLTKKRYVGYSYESPDQAEPVFDAKGIETVRRDTCGAVSKMLEKSLKIFFKDQDISKVKCYLQRQWTRILSGRFSIQDFIFAKEVRLGTYSSRSSSLPPAAIVATKSMRSDPRAEPRYGERVPYVVVHGEPGARLVDMVIDPQDLLEFRSPYRLNDLYYINKQIIPALQRVFGLVGADLTRWFVEMPRLVRDPPSKNLSGSSTHKSRIDSYYCSKHCVLCGEIVLGDDHLCAGCLRKEDASAAALIGRTSKLERDILHLNAICWHCGGGDSPGETLGSSIKCTSLACAVYYERRKVQKELQAVSSISTEAKLYPKCMIEWF